ALTLGRGVRRSADVGFARMGADLLIVPRDALVNITPALLTVEPTAPVLAAAAADEVAAVAGVERAAPQRSVRVAAAEPGHPRDVDLVVFDPDRDFTVLPWVREQLDRPLRDGDVLVGGRCENLLGAELNLAGKTTTVYARLGLTGVGCFDRAYFTTFATASTLDASTLDGAAGDGAAGDGVSAVLVRLAADAKPEGVRFTLAGRDDWKVVRGDALLTSVRQSLTAVFWAAAVFASVSLFVGGLMVGSVYSAVVAERRREFGLLLAIGMRGRRLVALILAEAVLATALGGFAGVSFGAGLLLLLRRSIVFHLEWADVPFLWPSPGTIAADALICLTLAAALGVVGAAAPAWRAAGRDPHDLLRAEAA
ncbi:MAG: ABC transporter permease, partial [Planctomycetia bacterium]